MRARTRSKPKPASACVDCSATVVGVGNFCATCIIERQAIARLEAEWDQYDTLPDDISSRAIDTIADAALKRLRGHRWGRM